MAEGVGNEGKAAQVTDVSGSIGISRKGKFHNGWTSEQEDLMEKWADMAACYRWLHDKCEKHYSKSNMFITVPVIILSTLTGTASVGLNGLVGDDPTTQKYAQVGIGAVSLLAGILTTLGNFFRYAQLSESNRVAGISWGKFQRQIAVELALHPNDRLDSMDFIKICRSELDRLIEQSPAIPDEIIQSFINEFKDLPDLKRPDICKGIEHTEAFKDKSTRIKQMASEAALMLKHKKRVLRDELVPDIDNRLTRIMEAKIEELKAEMAEKEPEVRKRNTVVLNNELPMPRSISAFEPEWRKLIQKTTVPSAATPLLAGGLPVPRAAPTIPDTRSAASLSEVAIQIETPNSTPKSSGL
jgi:hypothetical protein